MTAFPRDAALLAAMGEVPEGIAVVLFAQRYALSALVPQAQEALSNGATLVVLSSLDWKERGFYFAYLYCGEGRAATLAGLLKARLPTINPRPVDGDYVYLTDVEFRMALGILADVAAEQLHEAA